jgi:hypothetical protein
MRVARYARKTGALARSWAKHTILATRRGRPVHNGGMLSNKGRSRTKRIGDLVHVGDRVSGPRRGRVSPCRVMGGRSEAGDGEGGNNEGDDPHGELRE